MLTVFACSSRMIVFSFNDNSSHQTDMAAVATLFSHLIEALHLNADSQIIYALGLKVVVLQPHTVLAVGGRMNEEGHREVPGVFYYLFIAPLSVIGE